MLRTTPTEDELATALQGLRTRNPTLGISKLHTQLLAHHPSWSVSEKRVRKFLQNQGLVLRASGNGTTHLPSCSDDGIHPVSQVIQGLQVSKWTPKVQVQFFDKVKGKGLIATENISEGEVLWKEDPFILAPEWYEYTFATRRPVQP